MTINTHAMLLIENGFPGTIWKLWSSPLNPLPLHLTSSPPPPPQHTQKWSHPEEKRQWEVVADGSTGCEDEKAIAAASTSYTTIIIIITHLTPVTHVLSLITHPRWSEKCATPKKKKKKNIWVLTTLWTQDSKCKPFEEHTHAHMYTNTHYACYLGDSRRKNISTYL